MAAFESSVFFHCIYNGIALYPLLHTIQLRNILYFFFFFCFGIYTIIIVTERQNRPTQPGMTSSQVVAALHSIVNGRLYNGLLSFVALLGGRQGRKKRGKDEEPHCVMARMVGHSAQVNNCNRFCSCCCRCTETIESVPPPHGNK